MIISIAKKCNVLTAVLIVCNLCLSLSVARADFQIEDIRIEGLNQITDGTVFNKLQETVRIGDQFSPEISKNVIHKLYATGFFTDVMLRQNGNVLIVEVVERPVISTISFTGNKKLKTDTLTDAIGQLGIAKGRIFNRTDLDTITGELKNQYLSQGMYSTRVSNKVIEIDQGRVAIEFVINEGKTAKIKKITLIGNRAFSDKELLDVFSLRPKKKSAFWSRRNRYSKARLAADLEALKSFYLNRGYIEFKILSSQVTITPDKNSIYISISISEGAVYRISSIQLDVDRPNLQQGLARLVTMHAGGVVSRERIGVIRSNLIKDLGNQGYASAEVVTRIEEKPENKTVSIFLAIETGRRVRVGHILISGNQVTKDSVIRRELRLNEGDWYSSEKVERSQVRIQRLGYFSNVQILTKSVPGTEDQVDLLVNVSERSTDSFLVGVGYSDVDGIQVRGNVSFNNLFGAGKGLDITVNNSSVNRVFNISYDNPYYTPTGISRKITLNSRSVDATEATSADYILDGTTLSLGFTFPISEFNSIAISVGLNRDALRATSNSPDEFQEFIIAHPENDNLLVSSGVARDSRNKLFFPTTGAYHRLNLEASWPESDLEYYLLTLKSDKVFSLSQQHPITLRIGGTLGYGDGYGNLNSLPFYKNYFAGGATSVRGYDAGSIGPMDSGSTPQPIGGNALALLGGEVYFPMGKGSDDKRFTLFIDGGAAFDSTSNAFNTREIRYTFGASIQWFTAVGPIMLSYARPLNQQTGDDLESFQFTLGAAFR